MVTPLAEEFGYLGIGVNARKVMTGEHALPEGVDPLAAKLLAHLKMNDRAREATPPPAIVMVPAHVEGWRKAKERALCGSQKLHFGHSKAGAGRPNIAEFEAAMANIPH